MPMSGAVPMGNMDPAAMQKMMPSPNDPASTKDFKTADMQMMHNMHVPYTGNPDVDFRTHMILLHRGAVEMAKVALKHAKDPETRRKAQKIIDDQEKEIAEIRAAASDFLVTMIGSPVSSFEGRFVFPLSEAAPGRVRPWPGCRPP